MKKNYLFYIGFLIAVFVSCSKSEPQPPPAGKPVALQASFAVNEFQTRAMHLPAATGIPEIENRIHNVWLVISKGNGAGNTLLKYELTKNGGYYTTALERGMVSEESVRFYFIANADLIQDFAGITTLAQLQSAFLPEATRQSGLPDRYVMATRNGYKPGVINESIVIEKVPLTPTVIRLAFEYRNQLAPIGRIQISGTLQRGSLQGFFDSGAGTGQSDQGFTIADDLVRFSGPQGKTGIGYCYVYPSGDTPLKIQFEVNGHSRAITLPLAETGGNYPIILRYGVLLAYQSDGSVEYSGDAFLFPSNEVWLDVTFEEGGSLESDADWLSFSSGRLHCRANPAPAERSGTITLRGIDGQTEVFGIRQRGDANNPAGIEYVEVPAGAFLMGSPAWELNRDDDETQHPVTLSQGFGISKYEVTNEQFCRFLNALGIGATGVAADGNGMVVNPKEIAYVTASWRPRAGKEDFPIVNVTWYGASAFARWAGGALPTEAQWEYACRGGYENKATETRTKPFGVGNGYELNQSLGNFFWRFPYRQSDGEFPDQAAEVPVAPVAVGGMKASVNNYGIYDMHGNVWEWCRDHYDAFYGGFNGANPATDPEVFVPGGDRVLRGGSWYYYARSCRSAFRMKAPEGTANDHIGFRIVRF